MTPDLASLIERLEMATEGSRELDHDVFLATHPSQGTCGRDGDWWYAAHIDDDGGPWVPVPRYTTSLDAALTLVPAGMDWQCGYGERVLIRECAFAILDYRKLPPESRDDAVQHAATPALAICITSIKTRRGDEE